MRMASVRRKRVERVKRPGMRSAAAAHREDGAKDIMIVACVLTG